MKILDWLEEMFFRFFSESTQHTKDGWVRFVVYLVFLIPIVVGVVLDQIGKNYLPAITVFAVLFLPFCLLWIITWFYHNWKIKKLNKKWK